MPTSDEYRRGFIDGAVAGTDLDHALWAMQNDINGARVLRDEARAESDPETVQVLWSNVRHFVAEARMWSQIARKLTSQNRME